MKLRELEIFFVAPPAPGWGGRYWIIVKLTTDDGIVGHGECYATSVGPEAMRAVIADVFERHMLGENPENTELMFRRAYSAGFTQRPRPPGLGAAGRKTERTVARLQLHLPVRAPRPERLLDIAGNDRRKRADDG